MVLPFDETYTDEEVTEVEPSAAATETITYTRAKKGTGRKALPKSLPYIEQIHDLSDAEKQCACGYTLTHINDEVTEQLDIVPQMTFRVVHIRKKYACKDCEETIRLAKLPKLDFGHFCLAA
jgi:transposase